MGGEGEGPGEYRQPDAIWVRRSLPAGEPPLYDVFDTQGRHVKSVRFPESRTLLGFGDGVLYAARTDEFDQQFLERYDVP